MTKLIDDDGLWMTSGEVAKLLGMSRNTMTRWHQRGLVRARDSGVRRRNVPWMLYHVGDCERLIGARKKPEAFQHRVIDGVQMFRCNDCKEWKGRDAFYKDRTKTRYHGILSYCKECHGVRRRANDTPGKRLLHAQRAADRRRRNSRMAKLATDWSPDLLAGERAYEIIKRLRPHAVDEEISLEAGMPRSAVSDIKRRAKSGGSVTVAKMDRLLVGLDETLALREMYDELDRGRPKWHPKHDYCQRCLRTEVAHMAKGLCATCYRRRNDPTYVPKLERQWSTTRTHCVDCLRSDRPHRARGMCGPCYLRNRRRQGTRLANPVGSVHGDLRQAHQQEASAHGGIG